MWVLLTEVSRFNCLLSSLDHRIRGDKNTNLLWHQFLFCSFNQSLASLCRTAPEGKNQVELIRSPVYKDALNFFFL